MLQTGEVLIIALLALVVLGPRRLPEMARKAGQWAAELRKAAREITAGLEAEVSQFRDIGDEMRAPLREISDEMSSSAGKGMEWTGPKPLSGPTPADAMRDLERIQRGEEDTGRDPVDEGRGSEGGPAASPVTDDGNDDEPDE